MFIFDLPNQFRAKNPENIGSPGFIPSPFFVLPLAGHPFRWVFPYSATSANRLSHRSGSTLLMRAAQVKLVYL